MEILTGVFDFGPRSGGAAAIVHFYTFPRPVAQASAILSGFTAEFAHADHEIGQLAVELSLALIGAGPSRELEVWGVLGLRDWSGNWDDSYSGQMRYCVIVELEPRIPPIVMAPIG
jgi:hypothetical protein